MYLFNTQSGQTEPFTSPDGTVGIYVCGVTPYDTTHVGHAFTFLTFDILVRYLRFLDYAVTYVQNVTDIDDDILRKAKELGLAWDELGASRDGQVPPGHARSQRARLRPLHQGDRARPGDGRADRAVGDDGSRLRCQWQHLLRGREGPRVRQAQPYPARTRCYRSPTSAATRRTTRTSGIRSTSSSGRPPRRASRPGIAVGTGSPRLAHRVQRHVDPLPRSDHRHPRRRRRPGLPSPRVRDRPDRRRDRSEAVRPVLDARRDGGLPGREDEQVARQSGAGPRAARRLLGGRIRLYLFSHHYRSAWEYREDEVDDWATLAGDLREAIDIPSYGIEQEIDVTVFRERFLNAMDDDLDTPTAIEALRAISQSILEAPEEDDARDAQATLQELAGLLGLTLSD